MSSYWRPFEVWCFANQKQWRRFYWILWVIDALDPKCRIPRIVLNFNKWQLFMNQSIWYFGDWVKTYMLYVTILLWAQWDGLVCDATLWIGPEISVPDTTLDAWEGCVFDSIASWWKLGRSWRCLGLSSEHGILEMTNKIEEQDFQSMHGRWSKWHWQSMLRYL